MPNYAVIENGKVVNIVVSDADYANHQNWIPLTDGAGIGWDYANGQFTDNRPVPQPNPEVLTREQLLARLQEIQTQIQSLT